MSERYSDHLRKLVDPIWEAQHNHPFVTGIGDGTLDIEILKHWVRQDYVYLIDYARIMSMASVKSPDLQTMTWFADLSSYTLKVEMDLHRSYARDFGITEKELEQEQRSPTCQGYTDFLLRTAMADPFEVVAAALLPCFWGYYEIGARLEDRGLPGRELYDRWIKLYSNPEFGQEVDRCRLLIDRLGSDASSERRTQMEQAFLLSSRYEYLFWEMCYTMERWPV